MYIWNLMKIRKILHTKLKGHEDEKTFFNQMVGSTKKASRLYNN